MLRPPLRVNFSALSILIGTALTFGLQAQTQTTMPVPGLHEADARQFAIMGGEAWLPDGRWLKNARILLVDGRISAVDQETQVPDGFERIDATGKQILPGFVHLSATGVLNTDKCPAPQAKERATHWNPLVCPEFSHHSALKLDAEQLKAWREMGFTQALTQLESGVWRGQSAMVNLVKSATPNAALLDSNASMTVAMDRNSDFNQGYPNSLMGSIALIRQSLYDAQWYPSADAAKHEFNPSLQALNAKVKDQSPLLVLIRDELEIQRTLRIADEFQLQPIFLGSGHEYRRLAQLKNQRVVLPLDFPEAPKAENPELALDLSLERLQHWNDAPLNPHLVAKAEVDFALMPGFSKDASKNFYANLRLAIQQGLSRDQAIAALSRQPAKFLGAENQFGSLQKRALANLLIVEPSWPAERSIREVWVGGERNVLDALADSDYLGDWQLSLPAAKGILSIQRDAGEWQIEFRAEGMEPKAAQQDQVEKDRAEKDQADQDVAKKDGDEKKAAEKVTSRFLQNRLVLYVPAIWLGGGEGTQSLVAIPAGKAEQRTLSLTRYKATGDTIWLATSSAERGGQTRASLHQPKSCKDCAAEQSDHKARVLSATRYPAGEYGREQIPAAETVLFRKATVWMAGDKAETLSNTDVLIKGGKILKIGSNLTDSSARVVDATGLHLTPGLIDAHSHIATSGGVNEGSHTVSAEVRIGDVLDPTDINIYRQLAGGLTTAHLLHGSANAIGGQSQVIKLRWGLDAEALKFKEAAPTIKFALGENPKQSNWGDDFTSRYPQTRMGVEQIILDHFVNAQQYQAQGKEKRVNLRLQAIAEVLAGTRKIHAHSYRQDEILMLARMTQKFDLKIAAFQHVLEGYKVANVISEVGAGASTFADWWSFKPEVADAIPHNAAILMRAGVVTSLNSDSPDLARRLNTEAAKLIRFGGLTETEALSLVTTQPAKQLGVDQYVGSIAVGKQADLVLWNAPPLSSMARVQQTWVDGARYFDVQEDQQLRAVAEQQRQILLDQVLQANISELKPKPEKDEKASSEGKSAAETEKPDMGNHDHVHQSNRHDQDWMARPYRNGFVVDTCLENHH